MSAHGSWARATLVVALTSSAGAFTVAVAAAQTGGTQSKGTEITTTAARAYGSDGGTATPTSGTPATPKASKGKSKKGLHKPARPKGLTLTGARCVPASACSPARFHEVSQGGYLHLEGHELRAGQVVAFPRSPLARISRLSPVARISSSSTEGLIVRVPKNAHSGDIVVRGSSSQHSNAFGPIAVVAYALHPPAPPAPAPEAQAPVADATPFGSQGMWIWYLSKSDGDSIPAIAAQAKAAGVGTLYIKSSDGPTNFWTQFTPTMVQEVHAQGLKVCAWQYVYGNEPVGEAELGAEAVADGAECLVIDAESEYEGRYGAAQTYIDTLRAKIGATYPLGLASFPFVNYHESLPYSVFLGPDGAQFNVPQMYWKDIGTTVATVYADTFEQNLVYGRPICPLGQTFENPSATELVAFRSDAVPYSGCPASFWDWQETTATGWAALAAPLETAAAIPQPEATSPLLKEGAKGDQVLWLQEHLASAIPSQEVTGVFNAATQTNLESFQTSHGLPATGETDATTWGEVLALTPVAVDWTGSPPSG
jgi:hypothetical protein